MAAKISFQSNLEFTGINASLSRHFALIVKSSARSGRLRMTLKKLHKPISGFIFGWRNSVSELYIFDIWTITFSHSIGKKMKHRYQSFTRIGRQFQSLERQVYADWTSVSFPFCQRSCLIWRIMTNTLTNTMTNTYVVIFCRFQFLVEVIIPDIRISSSLNSIKSN